MGFYRCFHLNRNRQSLLDILLLCDYPTFNSHVFRTPFCKQTGCLNCLFNSTVSTSVLATQLVLKFIRLKNKKQKTLHLSRIAGRKAPLKQEGSLSRITKWAAPLSSPTPLIQKRNINILFFAYDMVFMESK